MLYLKILNAIRYAFSHVQETQSTRENEPGKDDGLT